jgi:glycosyltransferase involved in cell wall biosynthesis/SAM-dependent methyltransferase
MSKLRFAFAIPGLPFQGDSLGKKSLGGSETAGLCLMRELAALGHNVFAFTQTDKPGMYDGVCYIPLQAFQSFATTTPHDICVVQRLPELFSSHMESKLNVVWAHDLALKREERKISGTSWNIDKIACVSNWHAEQYRQIYGLEPDVLYPTRNGIDLNLFDGLDVLEHNPKKLIYTSRPERGLDVLLDRIFPELLKRDPELQLYLAGYDNPVEHLAPFYEAINARIREFGDRIVHLGSLTKRKLYSHYASAGCLVYPTPSSIAKSFSEVSCITVMEAMAAGLPVVTSNRGALPETLAPNAGSLILGEPSEDIYVASFCDAVMSYVQDKDAAKAASTAGRAAAKRLSWADTAKQWAADFERFIEERNDDKERLARHFVRRSNIILAKQLVRNLKTPSAKRLKAWLEKDWAFAESPDAYRQQYNKIGETHTDAWEGGSREGRLQAIITWLQKHPDIKTVVDVGCGLGIYAINISNALPHLKITGVDIDVKTIGWAESYRKLHAKNPDNVKFVVGREDEPLTGFDCALACEVLEHVPEPWDFLTKLEYMVKPGGRCYLTVPYGPWEALSYDSYPHRAHLWEYEPTDLDDMLSGKREFALDGSPCMRSSQTNEILGHFHFHFVADHLPIPKIDIERKLRLQRPRETVTATIIAGGNSVEETGNWCLRSVREIADEIIVADCGLTREGRRIVEAYADEIIKAPSPTEAGFETPRNMLLDRASMDWVFWIDTDERLLQIPSVNKYLRRNTYPCYSIHQHHFAVDSRFPPDMPVRLFRTKRTDGKKMRFIGMLHEHPETGLNEGPGRVLILPDVHIAHVGYLTEPIRRERFVRNYPLLLKDKEKHPNRLLQQHFIMRDNMLMAGYELAQNGGVISDSVRRLAQETKEIYRQHFLGKKQYANVDSLQYYTQAMTLLNEGFEVAFDLQANRDGVGDQINGHGTRARFATVDEAKLEIEQRLREKVDPLVGDFW